MPYVGGSRRRLALALPPLLAAGALLPATPLARGLHPVPAASFVLPFEQDGVRGVCLTDHAATLYPPVLHVVAPVATWAAPPSSLPPSPWGTTGSGGGP